MPYKPDTDDLCQNALLMKVYLISRLKIAYGIRQHISILHSVPISKNVWLTTSSLFLMLSLIGIVKFIYNAIGKDMCSKKHIETSVC